jgi:hypothetical protein
VTNKIDTIKNTFFVCRVLSPDKSFEIETPG